MKPTKFFLFLSLCLTSLLLVACQGQEASPKNGGLKIMTSFYPVYALTQYISGELNEVQILQSQSGIHGFEPSAADVAKIYESDVFIYHSHTLENWAGALEPNLKGSDVAVIEATAGMSLDRVKGLEDLKPKSGQDESSLYDPHTWTDPIKAAEEAQVIADQLSKIDPKNKKTYQANAQAFAEQAHKLVDRYEKEFAKAPSNYFVTSHTAFSYLAKRFGLEQLGIAGISTEQEPTSRQLAEIEEFVREHQVGTIFVEQGVSPKLAETVAQATGAELATLSPLEIDPQNGLFYLENLEENLKILLDSLKKAPSRASKTSSDQAAGHQGKESKTMAEIDQEEGISAEQVVISITGDGYVTSHGDHYHFYNGKVPFDALISQDLIWTDPAYQLNKEDIVHEVEDGYIIKRQDTYYLYLREGSQKVRIRNLENMSKTD